jgi:hypothetical protein
MKTHGAVAIALGATYFFGCLPVPWFYHTRADIDGMVKRNGAPVQGAKVAYSEDLGDTDCDSPKDTYPENAVSSDDGKFHFKGTQSFFHMVFLLPAPAEFGIGRICFDLPDGQRYRKRVYLDGGSIVGSIPFDSWDQLTIDCELAKDACTGAAR